MTIIFKHFDVLQKEINNRDYFSRFLNNRPKFSELQFEKLVSESLGEYFERVLDHVTRGTRE